jgi:hypothetical protein
MLRVRALPVGAVGQLEAGGHRGGPRPQRTHIHRPLLFPVCVDGCRCYRCCRIFG